MTAPAELNTVLDFLRYAVSRFSSAKLVFGHGVTSAVDEAAFIILEALHLPVDDINPWLGARLLPAEKQRLFDLIEARITSRKPAPYLLNKTYMHGVPFYVDERVIIPRSYIGEILMKGMLGSEGLGLIESQEQELNILDLCTGSGCLAVLAALTFPNATVTGTDISTDALEVAKRNVSDLELADRIRLVQGDLFAPVKEQKFDLILANPPYVAEAEVRAFPPEYRAEPQLAHLSGTDGFDLTRRILAEARAHLTPKGILICEIGTGAEILEAEYPDLAFQWIDTENSVNEVFALRAT